MVTVVYLSTGASHYTTLNFIYFIGSPRVFVPRPTVEDFDDRSIGRWTEGRVTDLSAVQPTGRAIVD